MEGEMIWVSDSTEANIYIGPGKFRRTKKIHSERNTLQTSGIPHPSGPLLNR